MKEVIWCIDEEERDVKGKKEESELKIKVKIWGMGRV